MSITTHLDSKTKQVFFRDEDILFSGMYFKELRKNILPINSGTFRNFNKFHLKTFIFFKHLKKESFFK